MLVLLILLICVGFLFKKFFHSNNNHTIYEDSVTVVGNNENKRVDEAEDDFLSLEVFTCIVDSIRGRIGPGEEYDEDKDWWSNIERGDNVWYLNTIKNGYYECLIRGFRGSPCVIWIPEDCIESTGKIEKTYFTIRGIKECNINFK